MQQALAGLAGGALASTEGSLVAGLRREILALPPVPNGTWFHPRACMAGDTAFMTLQHIQGSDYFGPVHWMTSKDLGRTWSEPVPAPPLGWEKVEVGHEGVCDVTPEYHAQTGSVLALGHNVFYRTSKFEKNQPPRWPIYAVWKDGKWGPRQKLEWDDPRGSYIYSNNCGQRVVAPNGEVMMSFTFGEKDKSRAVCGVRCSFDGQVLRVLETGNALTNPVGRGLLEPSLTFYRGKYYLTIRAEDERGYVSTSADGLQYAPQTAWAWDDGEPVSMSTTQQHWLTHSDGLFLVYTRKDASNLKVMRWRAPLWMAQVDTSTLRLIRSTERTVLPLIGDGINGADKVAFYGNFGVMNASAEESWITDGSWCPKDNNRGDVHLARVQWAKPNQLA